LILEGTTIETNSKFTETFRVCRAFHADHFDTKFFDIRLYFCKKADEIIWMDVMSFDYYDKKIDSPQN
jgi:hypothetical protein